MASIIYFELANISKKAEFEFLSSNYSSIKVKELSLSLYFSVSFSVSLERTQNTSYDMTAVKNYSIAGKFSVPSLGTDPGSPQYKTNALTTEPKSRLSDAVVRDLLYTRSYAKSTLCRYIGESVRPITLPLFKEVIIYDDRKPF